MINMDHGRVSHQSHRAQAQHRCSAAGAADAGYRAPMRGEDAVRDYVALALGLDRLVPGAVASYTGAPELRRSVEDGPCLHRGRDGTRRGRLLAAMPGAEPGSARVAFLQGQVRALRCVARRVAGRSVSFAEEVGDCFDAVTSAGEQDRYATAHREFDGLLPGCGGLAARMAAYRSAGEVPPPLLAPAVHAVSAALRDRVRPVARGAARAAHRARVLPRPSRGVRAQGRDAAALLHDRHAPADEVSAYLQRWLLVGDLRAQQMVRFLADARWRVYAAAHVEGPRLVDRWLHRPGAGDLPRRFEGLLDGPPTPVALREEIAAAAPPPAAGRPDVYSG